MASHENDKQKTVTSTTLITLFGGLLVFIALLIAQAIRLSSSTVTAKALVGVGPLHLMELQKNFLPDGGFSASLQISSGMLAYAALLLAIGLGLGFWRSRRA